jgi:hypothetical protein
LTTATDGRVSLSATTDEGNGWLPTAADLRLSAAAENNVSHGVSSSLSYCLTILDVPAATTVRTGFVPA